MHLLSMVLVEWFKHFSDDGDRPVSNATYLLCRSDTEKFSGIQIAIQNVQSKCILCNSLKMFDVRLGITNFVFCGYIRAYYTCFNQRQASSAMNHAKTTSNKLITIPFIFTKDLKKKIERNNECYSNWMHSAFPSNWE